MQKGPISHPYAHTADTLQQGEIKTKRLTLQYKCMASHTQKCKQYIPSLQQGGNEPKSFLLYKTGTYQLPATEWEQREEKITEIRDGCRWLRVQLQFHTKITEDLMKYHTKIARNNSYQSLKFIAYSFYAQLATLNCLSFVNVSVRLFISILFP